MADIIENDLARDAIQLHMATRREEGKAGGDLFLQFSSRTAEKCQQPTVESKFLAMLTDKIEYGAEILSRAAPQSSAQLL